MLKHNHNNLTTQHTHHSITSLLRLITLIEVLILLIAGVTLFFFPDVGQSRWVWKLTPFNTLFLGAIYLASLVPTAMLLQIKRWSLARMVLSMQLIFTALLLVVSLLYLERFNFERRIVWLWFFIYISIPINAIYHLWFSRRLRHSNSSQMPPRSYLLLTASILGLYGTGLFLAPGVFSGFWPWKLDNFHAQMYSAVFLTPAVGAFILSRGASAIALLTLGLTQLALGILPILGIAIADSSLHKIKWFSSSTWLWLGIFLAIAIAGIYMIWQSRRLNQSGT